jgi:hypothetical protein
MWYRSSEERIKRLEDDLYRARRAVLKLLPPTIHEPGETYFSIESREAARLWEDALVEATIELAWPLANKTWYSGPRAYCPLCRSGSSGPYVEGFALPNGLRKHLLGEGNARPCEVLIQVVELAREYWLPRVTEAEERERAEAEAEKSQRREREEMFLVDPRSAPQLRDETRYGTACRDDESMLWAEARLRQLGFLERRIGRVRQFTKEHGAVVVFADPRELGRLKFVVLRREQVDKPKSRRRWMPDHESFYLLDSWRNDLSKKLETRVGKAAGSLTCRRKSKSFGRAWDQL